MTEARSRSTTLIGPLVVVGVTYLVFFAGGYFGIYDVRVRISSLVIVGVVMAVFLLAALRSSRWFPNSRLWPALAIGIGVLTIDTVFSRNPRISLDFLAYGVILAALYLLLRALLARDDAPPSPRRGHGDPRVRLAVAYLARRGVRLGHLVGRPRADRGAAPAAVLPGAHLREPGTRQRRWPCSLSISASAHLGFGARARVSSSSCCGP